MLGDEVRPRGPRGAVGQLTMAVQKFGRMRRYAPVRHVVPSCLGKTKWNTEQAAQWSVTRIKQENPAEMSSTVRPYRCTASGKPHWHVGHGQ